jgi:hypothetical protein
MKEISLGKAALIAGIGLLIMVFAAPFAELYVYPKLIVPKNPAETIQNISAHKMLFLSAIFCYLITFICDVLVAWALYVLLVPANKSLSLLTALFRLIYTAIAIFALVHLVTIFKLINNPDYLTILGTDLLQAQVRLAHSEFSYGWSVGFFFFSIHLGLLGYLVFKSSYIPKVLGVLLAVAGLGYLIDTLKPFLFPVFNTEFLMVTFLGEVIFMLWLLIRGWKIQEPN